MAFAEEVQHDRLGQGRRLAVHQLAGVGQGPGQRLGRHHVAHAQARKERLVEGADIDHPLAAIEALQRFQRRAGIAELRGVVVLDDPGAGRPRPGQQLHPPAHREGHAQRILVRGGHEGHARIRRRLDPGGDHDPVAVDRGVEDVGPHRRQGVTGGRIAGVLHPHPVAVLQQNPGGDVDRMLGAGGDDHLVGLADHPARGPQIIADRRAQGAVAARVGIAEVDRIEMAQRPPGRARPGVQRAGVQQGAAGGEQPLLGLRRRQRRLVQLAHPRRHQRRLMRAGGGRLQLGDAGKVARDIGARARPPDRVALGQQQVVGGDHRGPRHPQPPREVAAGRQAFARLQRALHDRAAHLVVDLADDRLAGRRSAPGIDVGPAHQRAPSQVV